MPENASGERAGELCDILVQHPHSAIDHLPSPAPIPVSVSCAPLLARKGGGCAAVQTDTLRPIHAPSRT
eukprot:3059732-Rhodomonas_salina.1